MDSQAPSRVKCCILCCCTHLTPCAGCWSSSNIDFFTAVLETRQGFSSQNRKSESQPQYQQQGAGLLCNEYLNWRMTFPLEVQNFVSEN